MLISCKNKKSNHLWWTGYYFDIYHINICPPPGKLLDVHQIRYVLLRGTNGLPYQLFFLFYIKLKLNFMRKNLPLGKCQLNEMLITWWIKKNKWSLSYSSAVDWQRRKILLQELDVYMTLIKQLRWYVKASHKDV